ncbi:hypothetical protein PRUPE_7G013700 [Prunus persica]|uniref:CCHC-type domain-containing protein n=1 Tax=Prunus persica TaxID=3760 RepID=A0A251N4W7_PRUPE|nr:hypothetical protein PRUPE_7G013700 [Prunus persica]
MGTTVDTVMGAAEKDDAACYKCGIKGHWSRTYRMLKHLVNLYQESIKGKGKEKQTNYTDFDNIFGDFNEPIDITHLEVSNFFIETSGNIDRTINEGNANDDDKANNDGIDDMNVD